ncbi:hypothetical protein [Azospirillum argentinense]|uniref:DNA-binding protein n=1 Tax=Azospirillum argentinense TaxID=2970906 RepID=A0ABW8VI53_9PROT|nr:hypothetical protein [Azospirillum argentinense]EZQ03694.1 hypothetical protein ABAZ39_27290 [Azospirillum argentinense]
MTKQQAADGGALVWGLGSIAKHLGVTKRQAHYQHEKGNLPTFKPPGTNRIAALSGDTSNCPPGDTRNCPP